MKVCSQCETLKPLDQFQIRIASKDGLTAACKTCLHARDTARYDAERELRLERQKLYVKTPEGSAAHGRAVQGWRARNATKRAANVILNNAVRDGRVVPWPVCAVPTCKTKKVEGHHPDYDRPLDVVWLCNKHHRECHIFTRPTKRRQT